MVPATMGLVLTTAGPSQSLRTPSPPVAGLVRNHPLTLVFYFSCGILLPQFSTFYIRRFDANLVRE